MSGDKKAFKTVRERLFDGEQLHFFRQKDNSTESSECVTVTLPSAQRGVVEPVVDVFLCEQAMHLNTIASTTMVKYGTRREYRVALQLRTNTFIGVELLIADRIPPIPFGPCGWLAVCTATLKLPRDGDWCLVGYVFDKK